jgi:hypothetical protein
MDNTMKEYLIFGFLSLIKILVQCKNILFTQYCIFYEGSYSFKLTVDTVRYLYYFIFTNFTYYRVEPSFDNWACVCYLQLDNDRSKYYYSENYTVLNQGLPDEDLNDTIDQILYKNTKTIYENENIKEAKLIIKYNGLYLIDPNPEPFTKKMSKVRFLSIEYVYGKYKIEIVLPKEMFVVGNELFSPLFILRCLNYQAKEYEFNKDYTLFIMDSDLNNIQLTSDYCIVLEERRYITKDSTE